MEPDKAKGAPIENSAAFTVDSLKLRQFRETIKSNQNLPMGIVGGGLAALIGSLAWGGITFATGYQIGWMAVGVGFLVGFAVRLTGKGIDQIFGIVGAILALIGCMLGNVFATCIAVSNQEAMPLMEVIGLLNFRVMADILTASFHPMDLLFYGLAVYEGYKFSFRRLTREELAKLVTG